MQEGQLLGAESWGGGPQLLQEVAEQAAALQSLHGTKIGVLCSSTGQVPWRVQKLLGAENWGSTSLFLQDVAEQATVLQGLHHTELDVVSIESGQSARAWTGAVQRWSGCLVVGMVCEHCTWIHLCSDITMFF